MGSDCKALLSVYCRFVNPLVLNLHTNLAYLCSELITQTIQRAKYPHMFMSLLEALIQHA